jgi:hypothetical protein
VISGPTPLAKRKRMSRSRRWRFAARLLRRDIMVKFHPSDSCGGHLPWTPAARMRDCPDAENDLSGHDLWEGGQQ